MARPARIDFPDALCHVTPRQRAGEDLFCDADRMRFLDQYGDDVVTTSEALRTIRSEMH